MYRPTCTIELVIAENKVLRLMNNLPQPHGLPTDLGLSARQVRWSIGAGQLSSSPADGTNFEFRTYRAESPQC